jgi:peptidoglycan/xylan/chitin deacetylase (PgdA/CDA1 family)
MYTPQNGSEEDVDRLSPGDSIAKQASALRYSVDTLFSENRQMLKISGEAPLNTLLGLWNNGSYLTAAVSGKNGYEFPNQPLAVGKNHFHLWAMDDKGQATLIDSIVIEYSSRRISAIAIPINRIQTKKKILSLTFDGGSLASGADSIVNILSQRDIKTTFFLTGRFIQKYPKIVRSMIENQHELANHSFSHPHLTTYAQNSEHKTLNSVDRDFLHNQIMRTDSLLFVGFGHHFKPFWRAPFGEYNKEILIWAAEAGYRHVGWSREGDTRDWIDDKDSPLYRSGKEIYNHLVEMESRDQLRGAIILMHLHSDRKDDMPFKILPKLIDYLQKKGYQLLTISALIQATLTT